MRIALVLFAFHASICVSQAQSRASLRRYGSGPTDTMRMALLGRDGLEQEYGTFDTAIVRAREYLALAQRLQYPAVELHARLVLADATMTKNDTTGMEMMYDLEQRLQQYTVSRVPPAKFIRIMSSGDAPVDETGFSEWVKGLIYQSFSTIYWMNESGRAREFNDKAMDIFRNCGPTGVCPSPISTTVSGPAIRIPGWWPSTVHITSLKGKVGWMISWRMP